MLKRDRCLEEQRRLSIEADNLCQWYSNELAAVELVLHTPESKCPIAVRHIRLINVR